MREAPRGFVFGFIHFRQAWYAKQQLRALPGNAVDEVMIGLYRRGGTTRGEFAVRWYARGTRAGSPRLEAFHDAWAVLAQVPELLDTLRYLDEESVGGPDPDQVCEALEGLGFKDLTRRRKPAAAGRARARPRIPDKDPAAD